MRVLCVCLGNICRSPMAEGVLSERAAAAGREMQVESAGTGSWHVGSAPDPRAREAAAARGYAIDGQRARQIAREDFERFDLIVAMDEGNLAALERARPAGARAKVRLFHPDGREIPDPYFGGEDGFDHALDLIEEAADALIASLPSR